MLQPLYDLIRPYWPMLLLFVVYPVVTAALNWALWWDTPARWEAFAAKHPEQARWIRILRAVAPHLRKLALVWRDTAARQSAPGASTVVTMLSPPGASVVVVAEKSAEVTMLDARPAFDPTATITVTPEISAAVRAIDDQRGQRGFATVRALLAVVVTLAVAMAALGIGCGPRVIRDPVVATPPDGCLDGATTCHNGAPWRCRGNRWSQADRVCSRLGTDASPPPVCCLTQSALREDAVLHACVPQVACVGEAGR